MKKCFATLILLFISSASLSAQKWWYDSSDNNVETQTKQSASITFKNRSDYTMTLKIMRSYGGVYSTVTLPPRSNEKVTFPNTASYKLKIKAVHHGQVSYHDGGKFSVTSTNNEWTEGTMEFMQSTYGSGLGPKISAKDFESNN